MSAKLQAVEDVTSNVMVAPDTTEEDASTANPIMEKLIDNLEDMEEIVEVLTGVITKRTQVAQAIKEKTCELYNSDQVVGSNAEKREAKLHELLVAQLPEDSTPAVLAKLDSDIECLRLMLQLINEENRTLRTIVAAFGVVDDELGR